MLENAVIYTRFSPRPNAEDCTSSEGQYERCAAWCSKKQYHIQKWCDDRCESGGILSRPALITAIQSLAPGWILVVDRSDRLARDMFVALTVRKQVGELGAKIEYADGSPCGDSPEEVFLQNILGAVAAFERDRIRLRTKRGLEKKRKANLRTTSKIPIGWKLCHDGKHLETCYNERLVIKSACQWAAENKWSSVRIAAELNKKIASCRGHSWHPRTIRRLIAKHSFWACPISGDPSLEPTCPI